MNLFSKVFLVSFLISIIGFGLVYATDGDLLSGYAWSDNIGWISFNCTDISCASSSYGVTFDTNGLLSGDAWSDNIGWITFNKTSSGDDPGLVGCPAGTCEAKINTSTNKLSGWGRALSHGDGWDGWINLDCTSTDSCGSSSYGVSRDVSTQKLKNYAWGGDVVGWISFNCVNDGSCGASNYAVQIYGGDTTPPNSQITSPSVGTWHSEDFDIVYFDEDSDSGVDSDKCSYQVISYDSGGGEHLSETKTRTCGDPSSLSKTIQVGTNTDECKYEGQDNNACFVYLYATDVAGNQGVYSFSYNIDWTPPTPGKIYITSLGSDEPIEVTNGVTYTLKSDVVDNFHVSSCGLYINGVWQENDPMTLSSGTSTRTASVNYQFNLEPGTYHNNYVTCRDSAGNSASSATTFFTVSGNTNLAINSLSDYSSHCTNSPNTKCSSQYNCCMDFTTQTDCCVKFNVTAYDPSHPNLTYSWDFGDGETSTDENPYHHYNSPGTYTATTTVSNGTQTEYQTIEVVVNDPTLSVNLSAIPSFGTAPLSDVDLRSIVSGTMFGTIDYAFDYTNDGTNDLTVATQSTDDYTATDTYSYSSEGSYTAKTTIARGTGTATDTIDISVVGSCVYNSNPTLNATTTCNSDQGCPHEISCQSDSTWPACATDTCAVGDTQSCGTTGGEQTCSSSCSWGDCVGVGDCTSDSDCLCPVDACSGRDYYNYPNYGSCNDYNCNVETGAGDPCAPISVATNTIACNSLPVCNSLTANPSSGVADLSVILTPTATDDDGYINWYEFNFGDSQTETMASTSASVTHTYSLATSTATSSTYTVSVKAQDNDDVWSTVNATTSVSVTKNHPPAAILNCDASSCGVGSLCAPNATSIAYNSNNCQFVFLNESTDEDSTNTPPNNHIATSTWSIFYSGGASLYDPYLTYPDVGFSTMASTTLSGMNQTQGYYVLLQVEDAKGAVATTSANFYMRKDTVSSFDCSLDPGEDKVWKSCNGLNVSEGEVVYFRDLSSGSEIDEAGTNGTISSWDWTFTGGTPATSNASSTSASFVQGVSGTGDVTLTVTDSAGRTDTTSHSLVITIPLPEWQEIAPI